MIWLILMTGLVLVSSVLGLFLLDFLTKGSLDPNRDAAGGAGSFEQQA